MTGIPLWILQYPYVKPLDVDAGAASERWIIVMPLTFGRGRVCIADEDGPGLEFY